MFGKKKIPLVLVIIALLLYGTFVVLAAPPPSGGYEPGTELDPDCTPGSTDCFVKFPITTADNGLTATSGNVQLGGTLIQSTTINQNGNDFSIVNGNFSFENDNNLLGTGLPGIGLGYNDGTEFSMIGMIDSPVTHYPIITYSFDDGAGNGVQRQIAFGDVSLNMYNETLVSGNPSTRSSLYLSSIQTDLIMLDEVSSDELTIGSNITTHNVYLYSDRTGSTGNGFALIVNSETGVMFAAYDGGGMTSSYTFPLTDGNANQVLATDGAGQISWKTIDISPISVGTSGDTLYSSAFPTGQGDTVLGNNIFFGYGAGQGATGAWGSNFIGNVTGYNAANAIWSNFIGYGSGYGATNAANSNFFGASAGKDAVDALGANFFGRDAGRNATSANDSNFLGYQSGYGATGASYSNHLGYQAGKDAMFAQYSNFFGFLAGLGATSANDSNFMGQSAGLGATSASFSNFFGNNAGNNATGAEYSNFIGYNSGYEATFAVNSNFLGWSAGYQAISAGNSNFFGLSAGQGATNAADSNFLGYNAGLNATNAAYSNFFGQNAGSGAVNATNSIFIGQGAGMNDTVDNTLNSNDFSILIGKNTSTGGFKNSIAIGGSATNTASNQFVVGSTTRPITQMFVQGSGNTCTLTTGTGWSCSSDERLKTNINDLDSDTLNKLMNLRTVTYNWTTGDTMTTQVGFLAQNLEQYFPQLVTTDPAGYKSVYYAQIAPILVEAIREMNLNITDLSNIQRPNTWRDALIAWFGNVENGIGELFSKKIITEQLCLQDGSGQSCYTRGQLDAFLENRSSNSGGSIIVPDEINNENPVPSDENSGTIESVPEQSSTESPTGTVPEALIESSAGQSATE